MKTQKKKQPPKSKKKLAPVAKTGKKPAQTKLNTAPDILRNATHDEACGVSVSVG